MSEATASEHLLDLLFLANWNTRIVVLGVVMLGAAGGVVGSFMLLRRRVLIGDAVSHATLPGIAIAFLVATGLGFEGRSMPVLLVGALGAGLLGIAAIQLLNHGRRVSHDAALGVVLSTFFGTGVALLGVAQQHPSASVAGLESFIYGKTASMLQADAILIGAVALGTGAVCLLFFKEFRLVCFDPGFARGRGLSVLKLDLLLMSLVVSVVIVGLQAVGVVLVIAILVIPAASARFWTDSTGRMVLIAGGLGALGGWIGAVASAIAPRLPSGALVVLALGGLFLLSLCFGGRRGLLHQGIQSGRRRRRIRREHALRAILECLEVAAKDDCTLQAVAERRGWEPRQA
ncbi:MAG: metal ABC transporter permease, partial [Planctomycetota bacterium]|nr:metal ABC transporter permease [Planctomycetota bacterium]